MYPPPFPVQESAGSMRKAVEHMSKNEKRPSWFKMFLRHKSLLDAVPDDVAGKALKAALQYFDTGELVEMDRFTGAVVAAIKPQIDEAFEDFRRSVDAGRAGGQKRWGKDSIAADTPPIPPLGNPIGEHTEGEVEEEYNNIYCSVVQLLNDLTGSSFRPSTSSTQRLIKARIKEGFTQNDIETVIRHRFELWGNDKTMCQYLRPMTLFGSKFEGYLSEAKRCGSQQEPGYVLAPLEDPWEAARQEGNHA